ncbi:hypothetical protein FRC98_05205 [Lujinxingia vulgaris]|uniref:Uncharacterized protein n=1 Tax=Lujinxingia vulgaris TaxID=2600176 RepID=A0A5C6XFW0_9DELT|nr:hypothetical protein [Lujinxingia vulgaris]TXD38293.1 hypothetical protein FRC98_05205 [Lujinxingia vulgaris]
MSALADIQKLASAPTLDTDALASALDEADAATRLAFVRALTPKMQRRLFDAASRPVTTLDIVPEDTNPLQEVICEGRNTLPAFRLFQKRFCTPSAEYAPDNRRVLWGYNHQTLSGITGPGYFVAYDDAESGELVIDYRELPPERPGEWPQILDNRARLGRFVYAGMVDRLRGLSEHVTIGRAYKAKPMNAWFALVRIDP